MNSYVLETYPKVSLCIPTMDRYDLFLSKYLKKYLTNIYIDEIVISDENGNDTQKILEDYPLEIENKKIIVHVNSEKKGAFLNKRHVASLAKNEWVCLMDSDNFCDVDYFEAWTSYIKENGIVSNYIYMPEKTKPQNGGHQGFDFRSMGKIITQENYKNIYCQFVAGNASF
jgi:glycosyltransferase involved in cell wall biosynthesis